MKINNLRRLLALAGCVCVATELAAQNATVSPLQDPLSPMLVTATRETPVTPDEHPPSGGQIPGIGTWGPKHSFIRPSLRLSETFDSNPELLSSSGGSYSGFTNIGGNLRWVQYIGRDAEIQYSGAIRYDTTAQSQGYSPFTNAHGVMFSKSIQLGTWNLLIDDEAQYSQNSNFGAVGMEGMDSMVTQTGQWSGLSNVQSTSTSLQPNLLPNQSILTERGGRITNTALIEMDAHLDPRDIVTLAASYGVLYFNSSLLTNTDQASVVAGYNRTMTARDSIALEGAFTRFNYQNSAAISTVSTEYFSMIYARRLSGRSSIELGVGPQITQSSQVNQTYLGWQGRGTVRYRMRGMGLSAQAMHTISGGAGVFDGATTSTTGRGTVDFGFAQHLSMSISSGVSRNQQFGSAQMYDTQFGSFALNRKIGRYTNFFLSYDFQHQTNSSVCTGPTCGYVGLRNVFGIGFAWNYRPISVK